MSNIWRPTCSLEQLRARAAMLADIRRFFADRQVLEVETPLLCGATGTDPQLHFFRSQFDFPPQSRDLFLQTSPEFAMKRLLAAGSGCIYQICKAFRNGEAGRYHNPEFTILEWYRVGFDMKQLMAEVGELLLSLFSAARPDLAIECSSYREVFVARTGLDPLVFDLSGYRAFAAAHGACEAGELCGDDHSLWLDFIFSLYVQPALIGDRVHLIHGYPAIQSSLARIDADDARLSQRFEVFVDGVELGNGFYELTDADEQERRFDREIAYRSSQELPVVNKDQRFLAALREGVPDCSGVALGLDRLLMLLTDCKAIDQVLAFPVAHA
ncbi:EF-P lysine aminoacylase EpmA [Methylomonas sp. CM2]|uniref:EF-P lysine aminoacylase EpmA n=1 Tax=Methylomonas sp. CM2 TaxID=3417647 RepID=UPI003CFAA6FB